MRLYLLVCLVFLSAGAYAQTTFLSDTSAKLEPPAVSELTRKDLDKLSHKYDRAEKRINASSEKLLERLQRREQRMYDAVSARDSMAAKRLFTEAQSKYKDLQARLDKPVDRLVPRPLQEYVPRLDSLQTAMNFLGRMNAQLPADKIAQLQGVSGQLQQLEGRMQQAGEIQDFLRQREQLLKDNLTKFGMAKQLISINKEAFYYQQQMAEYKKSLNDPEKMEQIALRIANASPVFQGFMQKHSYLGVLFPPPAHYNTSEALKDIPTSAEVGDMIAKKIGSAGDKIDARQYLAQQAGQGHDQLASLKDKISKAGGDNSSAEIPQFKPNDQKTRSLLHRLEFGFNIQSQGSTRFLPVTTDLAVTIGYKLNRVIAKKVPGAGWEYIIYDQKSRPVFSQDANMRQKNQWLGNIYDDQDRIVQTGILTYSNGPVELQKYLNDNTGRNVLAGQAVTGNYMPGTFPVNYILTSRQAGVTQYFASGSITFNPGFTTEANANFTAEIIAGGNTSMATTFTQANDNPLPSGAGFIPLIYNYYNNYSATTRTYNTANNGLLNLDIADYADPLPSTASTLTTGLLTSKKVRVIEDANDLTLGNWLETANFYDDKGRIVQVQSDNYKGGLDYKTERYDFTGKVVCSYVLHNNPVAHISNLGIRTNTYYDAAGRVVMVRKIINETASLARITEYNQYDMLGKLKRKKLGQKCDAVTGAPVTISNPDGDNTNWLQINDYTYNIQGWLKGINWNYNSAPTYPDVDYQNNRWFALDLSYDWGFSSNQLNGALSGARWMSAGDGKERAYGYKYDATNRLLSADFRQNFGSGTSANWQVTEPGKSYNIDFSVKIGDGMSSGSAYDENGNILQMQQKGLVLNTSQLIDNLAYTYNKAGISNKLSAVTDNSGSTAVMGDFMDNNTTADDYGYDPNGNLITDMNKRLAGTTGTDLASGGAITYTYQGLPWLINVKKADQTSRGSIKFIYDATGKRLEKRVNEPGATIPNTNTTYLGAFVYVNDVLQYFNQENGKIRPTGNTQQPYAFDYFIKDQLHNTRVILTDEQQSVPFPAATVEQTPAASLTTEQSYYTVNTSNIVRMATIPLFQTATGTNYPNNNGNPPYNNNNNSNTSAQSEYMYRLNGQTGDKTGLGITIKVMTGDKVNLWIKSYYHVDRALDNSFSIANTALANFILAFAATPVIAAGAPHGATGASLQASPVTPPDVHDYLVNNRPTPSGAPKAFLNWILFDEQFRPVSTGTNSGFVAVATTADAVQSFSATATISTSGYLYVYCSNESNEDVYFDNLQAIQVKGPLLEETHYYPFGLTMEGISSRTVKANYTSNKIKLSGQIFDDELDLNTYQMQHRSMDPQIGRFQQIDPVSDKYCFNSTYAYAEDKVTLGTDLEGLELLPSNTGMFRMTAVSKPYYFGLTWEQSVQLVNRNVPSDFKGPDGTPLFSPSSVHIGTQGLMLEGVRGGAQFFFPSDQLPQNPSWPWDQSGADPDPSVSTSGRYLSPNIELSESWTAQAGAIASGRQELESWKNLIQSFPVWQAQGDLYDNMYKFDAAIALEATFDKSIAKSYPFAYTPEVKDNLINFIADGTFPNSVDIMSSNFRQNLETNLMTGYFGLQVLQRADPSYIQQSTLDSYNWMVNFYNSLPGIKYNFIPTFLPNNGGFVSDTGSSSSSSMEGVDWEGDYGEFFDGGGYGGYGGGDGGD